MIEDYLDGFTMGTETINLKPRCGTAACIAGWLCLQDRNFSGTNFENHANYLLGIEDREEGVSLFYTNKWPRDLWAKFKTDDLAVRAQAAAERIDRFIAERI